MHGAGEAAYTVQVLLPPALDARLEAWCGQAPGGTWPAAGGHVTLLPPFAPLAGLRDIRDRMRRVCRRYRPFWVRFRRAGYDRHLARPALYVVFLLADEEGEGYPPLLRLRHDLRRALKPAARDLFPQVSDHPFVPHITLTRGCTLPQARRLQATARRARLEVSFRVDRIWLVELPGQGQGVPGPRPLQAAPLGR